MRILLCAATEVEISPTILALSLKHAYDVQVLITGVGLMACTYALAKEVTANRPDIILQAGVAGTLHPELHLATVVAVRSECIGDMGVNEDGRFRSIFDLKLEGTNTFPWHEGKLVNENTLLADTGLPVVDGVTVSEISTHKERIMYYRDGLNGQVESMEGAALHYVGLSEKIPFLQIRSLSNYVGERDKKRWKMEGSISHLNSELQQILSKLETL